MMETRSVSREFWLEAKELAARCLNHPFVKGIGDGTLPADRFADYIAQDAIYVLAYARAFSAAIARAPDRASVLLIHELLAGTMKELEQIEQRAINVGISLDAIRPAPATQAYVDLLMSNAFNGSLGELMAAMTPCMRLYAFLGDGLYTGGDVSGPYEDWIRTYSSVEYKVLVEKMETILDRFAKGTATERDRYRQAMELELQFFDAAWKGELAPVAKEAR